MSKPKILLVDDESQIRTAVRRYLELQNFEIQEADSCQSAVASCRESRPDVVLLDYMLPDGNALTLLPSLQEIQPEIPVIILTGHGTVDLAVEAMKAGAEHFVTKPLELAALHRIVLRSLENQRNRLKVVANESRIAREFLDAFVGQSPGIRRLARLAEKCLRTDGPILIEGETGSGKGTLAMWLHKHSPRAGEAFVDLNCAGLSRELLETELFGHERGAFTGAVSNKMGLLDVAHRGTVFLDEIGDADLMVQAKLLKVLEEKRFRRLGDVRDRQVDVRLIAATHHDLRSLIKEQKFRSDLYFRISTVLLRIPPLRERPEDITPLAAQLLQKIAADMKHPGIELIPKAAAALEQYSWPGNIRELRNVLERAVLLSESGVVRPEHLRFEFASKTQPARETPVAIGANSPSLAEMERRYIQQVIEDEQGNVARAAQRLGVPRSSLYKKVKAMEISVSNETPDIL
jgi:DNA-binding NtrC family response regulator